MPEQQPSPQQKSALPGGQTAQQRLEDYRKLLQETHDLLLAENNLQEILQDEKRVPLFKSNISTILKWIKTVEDDESIVSSFTDAVEGAMETFKETIENAILYLNVVLDVLTKEKQALEKKRTDEF